MKKLTRIKTVIVSLGLILGIGCGLLTVYAKGNYSWTEVQIEEKYELQSDFVVPQRKVVVNGKEIGAKATVTTPDGTVTKENKITLNEAGKYTITYTASKDGKHYVEKESFLVNNNLYSFTSDESSASWGKYKHAKDTEGLMIRLAAGDTFTLNQPIDISRITGEDILVQAFATPDSVGHADFKKLCFQFTDVNDPSIKLYISAIQADMDETVAVSYYAAGGNGQTPKGYEEFWDNIHEEGHYGAYGIHGFGLGGKDCAQYCDEQPMTFRVDFSSMCVYHDNGLVIDLDSEKFFDTIWEGFTSDKVILTIWADMYSAKTANFCLSEVAGIDLTQKEIVDTEPPVITVDTKYETAPSAVAGGCYQYIPKASAKDLQSGVCDVTTKVYFNYQSPNKVSVNVKKGTFKTDRFGHYAIVYEAEDAFGNVGREIVWVKAENELQKPTITLKDKPEKTIAKGEKFVPAEYTYSCHSGKPTIKVYATKGDKTYDLKDGYRFEKEGTYTVVYEITDCAGQVSTYEYKLKVKVGDRPVLGEDIQMPQYMIENSEYVFPKIRFYDYRSGKKETKIASGKIIDANGEKKVEAGDTYTVTVEKNGDPVRVVFECENSSYEVSVPTIKSWGQKDGRSILLLENYFVGDGFTLDRNEKMTFKATAQDGGWCFANALLAEKVEIVLQGIAGQTSYESLVLELQDSENQQNKLTIELPYDEECLLVKTEGVEKILKKGSNLATSGPISVQYKAGELYVAGVKLQNIGFKGFSSDKIYASVHFKGAQTDAAFELISLNNHSFGTSMTDRTEAEIVVNGKYGGVREIGSEILLSSAMSGDVFNPNVTFTVTVKNGTTVLKDINGKKLQDVDPTKEYTIEAEKYGRYLVEYKSYDSFSEEEAVMSYVIHVADTVAPELTFKTKKVTEAKVGDVICIPSYTVSDNTSAEDKLIVRKHVEDPNGILLTLAGESNAIKASVPGKYKFVIVVLDEEGNVTNVTWSVTVTEE